jgi:hypothetical protein
MSDARGEPLFVVTAEANASLVAMLPKLLDEVRSLVGERRVTVVFDRGGWSPAKLRAARERTAEITCRIGSEAALKELGLTQSRRALLDRHVRRELGAAVAESMKLERRRAAIPRRIPVGERTLGEVVKLATERKHLSNLLKMVAYQIESDLARAVAPHYRRANDEGRTLVQASLASAADITVAADKRELRVLLAPMSSGYRTRAIAALCQKLTAAGAERWSRGKRAWRARRQFSGGYWPASTFCSSARPAHLAVVEYLEHYHVGATIRVSTTN